MMSSKEIEEKLRKIVATNLGIDESKVVPEASFIEDLGADSLDRVELTLDLELHFSTSIPDEVSQKFRTVQDAIDYLSKTQVEA